MNFTTRDFSRKMNATFEFVKQNFKPLGKSILFIAGPPVLVASLASGSFMGDFMSFSVMGDPAQEMGNYFTSVSFWLEVLLMLVFFTIGGVMNIATVNSYLLLYEKKRSNKIEVSEVWEQVRATFWMYFSTMFLFSILVIGFMIAMVIPMVLLWGTSPFLVFFLGVFCYFGFIYFFFAAAFVFIIRAYEGKTFFDAIFRSVKLIKDKWWSTFGLIVRFIFDCWDEFLCFSPSVADCYGRDGIAPNFYRHFSGAIHCNANNDHCGSYIDLPGTDAPYGIA